MASHKGMNTELKPLYQTLSQQPQTTFSSRYPSFLRFSL